MSKNLERAMTMAAEYERLAAQGQVMEAEQAKRTIEDLVGHPVGGGRVELPRPVAQAMRRPDLAAKEA